MGGIREQQCGALGNEGRVCGFATVGEVGPMELSSILSDSRKLPEVFFSSQFAYFVWVWV